MERETVQNKRVPTKGTIHLPSCVEIVDISTVRVVIVDILDFRQEACTLLVGITNSTEAAPQREQDDLCIWSDCIYIGDEIDVGTLKLWACYVVGCVVVVRPNVDHCDVGLGGCREVP